MEIRYIQCHRIYGCPDPEHEKLSDAQKVAKTYGILRYVFGVLFIIIGLFKVFFGKRYFSVSGFLVLAGFWFGFCLNFGLIFGLKNTGWAMIPAAILCIPFGILLKFFKAGLYFFGANVGLIIAMMINSLINTTKLEILIPLSVILPIIFGGLTHFILKNIVIFSTPFIGANMFITGISLVINNRYIHNTLLAPYDVTIYWALFGSTFGLTIIGFLSQFYFFGLEKEKDNLYYKK